MRIRRHSAQVDRLAIGTQEIPESLGMELLCPCAGGIQFAEFRGGSRSRGSRREASPRPIRLSRKAHSPPSRTNPHHHTATMSGPAEWKGEILQLPDRSSGPDSSVLESYDSVLRFADFSFWLPACRNSWCCAASCLWCSSARKFSSSLNRSVGLTVAFSSTS